MSGTRDSPSSPRITRQQIEQPWDGWDECSVKLLSNVPQHTGMGAAKVKTPSRTSPSPLPYKCPPSPRNFHTSTSSPYEQQPPCGSPSGRSSGYNAYVGGNNGRSENPPRSPKITTTYATESMDDIASTPSYYQTPSSGSYSPKVFSTHENSVDSPFYSSGIPSVSPRRSPKSPRKFVFDAISPLEEVGSKEFEYYEPVPPDSDPLARANGNSGDEEKYECFEIHHSPKVFVATPNTARKDSQKFGRCTGVADRQRPTYAYGEESSYSGSHRDQQAIDWDLPSTGDTLEEFRLCSPAYLMKRDSCVTESTQLSAESNHTNTNTTAITTTSFSYSERSQADSLQRHSKSGTSSPVGSTMSPEYKNNTRHRRDAINITSNPAYHVLHSSHSTLGHTCSDSVVSLRYRKSTSDLTKDKNSDFVKTKPSVATTSTELTNASNITHGTSRSRRRGSSKGGLAYLASRRSSRESMKSACSNASIFSNDDDIGPLAFQASNRSRQRRTSNFLELPVPDHIRPRVCSLPDRPYNPRASDDLYRLRHFSISKGNVVNCGDSIISRRSRSNTSVNSTNSRASERSPFDGSCCGGGYANVDSVPESPDDSENSDPPPPQRYRVVMLGDAGVGKTALVSQFMTSEYMHTYDASLDDEFGEKTVSVLLDNEESELVFIDHPSIEMSVENSLSTYEPHGCVVTFSVVDRSSFRVAEEIVNYLWQENYTKNKAVILVGNKADLARSRVITMQEGKSLAASRGAKFIETSSGIQHNVDELLVGILKQMRLKETRVKKATSSKLKTSRTHISLHLAKEILQKICLSDISKSKSCENLHVL